MNNIEEKLENIKSMQEIYNYMFDKYYEDLKQNHKEVKIIYEKLNIIQEMMLDLNKLTINIICDDR